MTGRERPIIFSAPMVHAILAGEKTQTRRILRGQPQGEASGLFNDGNDVYAHFQGHGHESRKCPYGTYHDQLWVREPMFLDDAGHWCYEADGERGRVRPGGQPTVDAWLAHKKGRRQQGRLMLKAFCRLTLEITDVRVERLQDISEEDAKAEGVAPEFEMDAASFIHGAPVVPTHMLGFKHVWKDIHGPESWEANPWVWVLSFRVVVS